MSLATKNGSLIVTDGKLATDCACCGGWYCCASHKECDLAAISSVKVNISSQDYFFKYRTGNLYVSEGVAGSAINGVIDLPVVNASVRDKEWKRTIQSPVSPFVVDMVINILSDDRAVLVLTINTRLLSYVGSTFIAFDELASQSNVNALSGSTTTYQYAECQAISASVVAPFSFTVAGQPDPAAFQSSTTGSPLVTVNSLQFVV